MIKNNRQLSAARAKLAAVQEARSNVSDEDDRSPYDDLVSSLEDEISGYGCVTGGFRSVFELSSVDELGGALVSLRLARGLTQKSLAARLGIAEQQVQRWESREYEQVRLWSAADVVDALGYSLRARLVPKEGPPLRAALPGESPNRTTNVFNFTKVDRESSAASGATHASYRETVQP